jgi:hypothetical protein
VAERKLLETYPDPVVRAAKLKEMTYGRENNWRDTAPVTLPDGSKVETLVYRAHSLRAVWATPPYLHNGSVPTLWHLLHPGKRPAVWRRLDALGAGPEGEATALSPRADYDFDRVGLAIEARDARPEGPLSAAERRTWFDTSRHGKGAGGHTYPDLLDEGEKSAVLEYLKTL